MGIKDINAIDVDQQGNVYSIGEFYGIVDFDPNPAPFQLTAMGSSDIYIHKFDNSGNFVWVKQFGNTGPDYGNGIAVDSAGNVYSTGIFSYIVDFDPGIDAAFLSTLDNAAFVSKLTYNGDFVWAFELDGSFITRGSNLALDGLGYLYTTGIFHGTLDLNPGVGTNYFTSQIYSDIYISKYDTSGVYVWGIQLEGDSEDLATDIEIDHKNNVYATGYFSSVDFDPGANTHILTAVTAAYYADAFILKLGTISAMGIQEPGEKPKITIYPNPAREFVYIDFDEYQESVDIKLHSLSGQLIGKYYYRDTKSVLLDLRVKSGIYFLEIDNKKQNTLQKIIVDK